MHALWIVQQRVCTLSHPRVYVQAAFTAKASNNKTFIYKADGKFGPMSSSVTAFPDFLVKLCISGCHSLHTCKD